MVDRLDVVPVGIEDEGCEVPRGILGPLPRTAVAGEAGACHGMGTLGRVPVPGSDGHVVEHRSTLLACRAESGAWTGRRVATVAPVSSAARSQDPRIRRHVIVSGRVQGVFFRDSTQHEARRLGVDGWVRNLDDGTVEAVFEGDVSAVEAMLDFCRGGPERARVDRLEVEATQPLENLAGFEVR